TIAEHIAKFPQVLGDCLGLPLFGASKPGSIGYVLEAGVRAVPQPLSSQHLSRISDLARPLYEPLRHLVVAADWVAVWGGALAEYFRTLDHIGNVLLSVVTKVDPHEDPLRHGVDDVCHRVEWYLGLATFISCKSEFDASSTAEFVTTQGLRWGAAGQWRVAAKAAEFAA